MGMHVIQTFVDRVFLMGHSIDEMAAALPAGVMHYTFSGFFVGIVSYVNTFVAQYLGSRQPERIGKAVWQGIFFAALAGVPMLLLMVPAPALFHWFDHDPAVVPHEITYFRGMSIAAVPMLLHTAGWCFFSGRGKTWVLLIGQFCATVVNIVFDYLLIYGKGPFPEMGIAGAALATALAHTVSLIICIVLFLLPRYRAEFGTLNWRPDLTLCRRIIRYGLPQGVQIMLDVMAFSLLLGFIGRIGKDALTATNIAFEINFFAFIPIIGLGHGLMILVGQAQGQRRADLARRTTWSGCQVGLTFMSILCLGYLFTPQVFFWAFQRNAIDPEYFARIEPQIRILLKFVAFYSLFDALLIVFSSALKGAGDTRFVMVMSILLHWGGMLIPGALLIHYEVGPAGGLYAAWCAVTFLVLTLGTIYLLRFLGGKWESMSVIEIPPSAAALQSTEAAVIEPEMH